MRIAYYSTPAFADCDFPLVKALRDKGHKVFHFIAINNHNQHSTIIDINRLKRTYDIFKASEYEEMLLFRHYLDLDDTYIVNSPLGKVNWKSLKLNINVIKFVRRLKCDILQTTGDESLYGYFFAKLCAKKSVLTVHDPIPHSGSEKNKFRHFIRKSNILHSDALVLLNMKQTDGFIDLYGVDKCKIYYTRLGFYECMSLYEKDYIKRDKNQVLYFGRISRYKGIDILLEAFELVHTKFPSAKLYIAGGGDFDFDISSYLGKDYIKIDNRYLPMPELASLINNSAFCVCPYKDATQSGVVCTCFALNTPLVVTNVGGLADYVKNGETGLVVTANDQESLANGILKLLEDESTLYNMRSEIKKIKDETQYSWSSVADKYIEIYSQTI